MIGAGPTGVEMAGQIAELSRRSLKGNFRRIDPASARVLLLDGVEAPLATFGEKLSAKATSEIERTGVQLRMRSLVTDVKPDAIVVQGPDGEERIACHTKVWSAGVQASPLGAMLVAATGAGTDRAGHVQVLPDCTLPGHPEVFVVGDMMSLNGLPGVAEVAMQSGIHAARTIKRRVQGDAAEARPFVYRDLGSMATISRFRAIVSFKGLKIGGFLGWLMWAFVHLTFLTGFKNRWIALFKWLTAFVGSARDERTITMQQVSARVVGMHVGIKSGEESLARFVDERTARRLTALALLLPQGHVAAAEREQLGVGASLDHAAAIEHQHLVHLLQAGQPVGDQQGRDPAGHRQQVGDDRIRGLRVQVLAGLVEDEQREIGEQRPGDGQAPALTAGHARAALPHLRVKPRGQPLGPLEQPRPRERRAQLLRARPAPGQAQVLLERAVEHVRVLGDQPDDRPATHRRRARRSPRRRA